MRAPKFPMASTSSPVFPSAYLSDEQGTAVKGLKKWKSVEEIQWKLTGLDMSLAKSFFIDKQYCVEPAVLNKMGPALATAKLGAMALRVRSGPAYAMANAAWKQMPEDGLFGRETVRARVEETFFADGGVENTLGRVRLAYPKVGEMPARPVTRAEAHRALLGSGVSLARLKDDVLAPYPLFPTEVGGQAVTINPKSSNGLPVLGKFETPLAAEKVLGLAAQFRKELTRAARTPEGVEQWKERMEATNPQMVACLGKAKGDYYRAGKLVEGKMRFYNVLPRQIALNMQVATQPLEALALSYLEGSNSGHGVSLHHGGAAQLVAELDARLAREGRAFVHVGDDSWVVVRVGSKLCMFALDCSNFDLTQHGAVTAEVHRAIHTQLARIDAPAADLWLAYARSRLVVVAGSVVRKWPHAGPSGMPLQSKINDMLMDVLIERALERSVDWQEERAVDECLQLVGRELGFSVRVEQHAAVAAESILGALEQVPFLFVGYYFHVREGSVRVFADWARQLAQLPYPGLKWMKSDKELKIMEAMRLGCFIQSLGMPPPALDAAYAAMREYAIEFLEGTLDHFGDQTDERLRWAVGESPMGPGTAPSLSGLRSVLLLGARRLWLEKPLAKAPAAALNWADMVEEEEEAEASRKERVPLARGAALRPIPVPPREPTTHPVTARNDGRPPPTAVWGPNKAPRRLPGGRRGGRVLRDADEWEESEEESWEVVSERSESFYSATEDEY